MLEPITLQSGHILEVGTPDLDHAKRLYKAMARELATVQINLDLGSVDLGSVLQQDVSSFKNVICALLGSDAVEACVLLCAGRSLLNGKQIGPKTFEPEEMREDYFPVVWEVTKRALTPFFKGLSSLSSSLGGPESKSPRSAAS